MNLYKNSHKKIYFYKMIKNLCILLVLYTLAIIDYPSPFKENIFFNILLILLLVNSIVLFINFLKNAYRHAIEISKE
ncbi:hypothetical protein CN958_23410 [Bacillus cereus]|uniref:Sensor histidine kinase n=1 Tax=Bacillus cereus TaxID=1396 RepID=A0A2B9DRK1_BACCE|nr:hypothetical protein CN958_23410 [Bacillus cereus]